MVAVFSYLPHLPFPLDSSEYRKALRFEHEAMELTVELAVELTGHILQSGVQLTCGSLPQQTRMLASGRSMRSGLCAPMLKLGATLAGLEGSWQGLAGFRRQGPEEILTSR